MNTQPSAPDTKEPATSAAGDFIPVVPLKHPVRLALAIVLILVALSAAWDVAVNERYRWDVVVSYIFAPQILAGAGLTILLTVVSMTVGIALGTLLAIMRLSDNPILSTISRGYIWFFRGTPLLVQLIFWYNIAALYPVIAFGLPFGGPSVVLGSANVLISPLGAALLGLSLNEAAYMAEIIRGGIGSVDKGQYDAARALGMSGGKLMGRVILPQAMRVVLPPHRQPGHFDAEGHLPGERPGDLGPALLSPDHLCEQLSDHSAADRCESLVPAHDHRPELLPKQT